MHVTIKDTYSDTIQVSTQGRWVYVEIEQRHAPSTACAQVELDLAAARELHEALTLALENI